MGAAIVGPASPFALEIDCVRCDARGEVTHVCGPGTDGRRWSARLEVVVAAIDQDGARYFVSRGSQQFGLQVKDGRLATMMEDGWSVRSLPVCSGAS